MVLAQHQTCGNKQSGGKSKHHKGETFCGENSHHVFFFKLLFTHLIRFPLV